MRAIFVHLVQLDLVLTHVVADLASAREGFVPLSTSFEESGKPSGEESGKPSGEFDGEG